MKFINLQPHAVNLPNAVIEPSGSIARVSEQLKEVTNHPVAEHFSVYQQSLGEVTVNGLPFPEQQEGIYYIVSLMVAQAMPHRMDLLIPVGQQRDSSGKIVGCTGLAVNAKPGCNPVTGKAMRGVYA